MTPDQQQQLNAAMAAARAGDSAHAQTLLLDLVQANDQLEPAWWWLSQTLTDPADRQVALENVLTLNPQHAQARAALNALRPPPQPAPTPKPAPPPVTVAAALAEDDPLNCLFCGQPTSELDDHCPHCGRGLLAVRGWRSDGYARLLLLVVGLLWQTSVIGLGPLLVAVLIGGAAMPDLMRQIFQLDVVTQVFGDITGWGANTALLGLTLAGLRAVATTGVVALLLSDHDGALNAAGALAVLEMGWAGLAWAVYAGPLTASINGVLALGVLMLWLLAQWDRSHNRRRLLLHVDADVHSAAALHQRAIQHMQAGRWALAALHWQKAVVADRRFGLGYKQLALARAKLGRPQAALAALDQGADLDPHDPDWPELRRLVLDDKMKG